MSIVASPEPRIRDVKITSDEIVAYLLDGRVISVPLAWSWRLSEATPAQRAHFRLIGDGEGVHWPDVDEDISVEGMLRPQRLVHFRGIKSHKQRKSPNKRMERTGRTGRSS